MTFSGGNVGGYNTLSARFRLSLRRVVEVLLRDECRS